MKKIVIITFYFGKSPWYLDHFIQSCIANKDVDFIFYTDIKNKKTYSKNFKIINISFEDFTIIISKQFNFELNIKNPLKLCDIRPSFGEVFHDIIQNYDFWGYCDIDIIFGRIRSFLDEDALNTYDVFFSNPDYPSGFFAIYKNEFKINKLYRSSDYKKTFQNSNLLLFDECGGHYDEVCSGVNILDTNYEIDSMHHILERKKNEINILYEFLSIDGSLGNLRYKNGILIFKNEFEILLYHLTNFKKNYFLNQENDHKLTNYNSYYIGKYNIIDYNRLNIFINILYSSMVPIIKIMYMKLDYFFNNKILSNSSNKKPRIGIYQYMNRTFKIDIQNGKYYIIHNNTVNEIFFLRFSKNIFYEKTTNQFYLMKGFENNYYTTISLISKDGTIFNYKLNNYSQ